MGLPEAGAVLGLDIGYSPTRRTSAACCLSWTAGRIVWRIQRFRYQPEERQAALLTVAGQTPLLAAALDGPFRPDLAPIDRYRLAERMLTRRLGVRIGKPGASNTPTGRALAEATAITATDALRLLTFAPDAQGLCPGGVPLIEAFPNSFLGVMLDAPDALAKGRVGKSDRFYAALTQDGTLSRLLMMLLPGRSHDDLASVTDHDDRAGLVCALTALGHAAGRYTAVGDGDGWIVLPPWDVIQPWQRAQLEANGLETPGALRVVG